MSASLTSIKHDVVLTTNEETLIMILNDRTNWTLWSSSCTTRRPSCKVARCAACDVLYSSLLISPATERTSSFKHSLRVAVTLSRATARSVNCHESLSVIIGHWTTETPLQLILSPVRPPTFDDIVTTLSLDSRLQWSTSRNYMTSFENSVAGFPINRLSGSL